MDSYYQKTRPRIQEYCSRQNNHQSDWDSQFLVCGKKGDTNFRFLDNSSLENILDLGADIYRSLWSRQGSLFFLDLDFKNTRDEQEIYNNNAQIFRTSIEPVYREISSLLQSLQPSTFLGPFVYLMNFNPF